MKNVKKIKSIKPEILHWHTYRHGRSRYKWINIWFELSFLIYRFSNWVLYWYWELSIVMVLGDGQGAMIVHMTAIYNKGWVRRNNTQLEMEEVKIYIWIWVLSWFFNNYGVTFEYKKLLTTQDYFMNNSWITLVWLLNDF